MAQVNDHQPSAHGGIYAILVIIAVLVIGAVLYFSGILGERTAEDAGIDAPDTITIVD